MRAGWLGNQRAAQQDKHMLRLLSMALVSAPLWGAASIGAAQLPAEEPHGPRRDALMETRANVVAGETPRWPLWTIVPIELSVVALFAGLVTGTLTLGDPGDQGQTSASYSITELRDDRESARTAAIVADGFYVAAAGGVVVQLAVILPLCVTTKICDMPTSAGTVAVGKRGDLVIRW